MTPHLLLQEMQRGLPIVGPSYLECEIDDEVVIPKCFAPLLSFPQDLYMLPPPLPQAMPPAFAAVAHKPHIPAMRLSRARPMLFLTLCTQHMGGQCTCKRAWISRHASGFSGCRPRCTLDPAYA